MLTNKSWDVHKFGGTSVGSAACMRGCIEIVKTKLPDSRIAMVVSAMGGKPKVTDLLLDSVHAAAKGDNEECKLKLSNIYEKHSACLSDLFADTPEESHRIMELIRSDVRDIEDLLRAVALMKMAHEQILELVSGYGEVWSATILAAVMKKSGLPFIFLNARDVLLVSENELGTIVHWEESELKLNHFISEIDKLALKTSGELPNLVITGYVASTLSGVATTLKRDGSDFSASIFGKMLNSKSITIWTDVSGVYSADPRRVPEAQIIPEVSYTEAIELAYFGAKVIHPKTMSPAIMAGIPIYIRNTFDPTHPGTRIYVAPQKGKVAREKCVCGFSTVDNIALLNIEGSGMIGVPGIAHRLFGALKTANTSVMFIAQASSEHSICFATKQSNAAIAKKFVEEAFFYELQQNLISSILVIEDCSIIAAVGENMSNTPGVSGIFFRALGDARINILSISQGCDERNISAVVHGYDAARALKAVHAAFWLSSQVISVGVVGTGRVGSAVLQFVLDQLDLLKDRFDLDAEVRGIANSKKMILGENLNPTIRQCMYKLESSRSPSPGTESRNSLARSHSNVSLEDLAVVMDSGESVQPADLDQFLEFLNKSSSPHVVIIDCTPSSSVAAMHPSWLRQGVHVITANKRALASSLDLYNDVYSAARSSNRSYMSEVTIGASIPIMTTLQDLLASGDAVHSILGLMSVSVGHVLSSVCDEGLSLSAAITKTYSTGLFEDDVFQDLEGIEAAQKLLILSRALGVPFNISDIEVEPIVKRRNIASWDNITTEFAVEDELLSKRASQAATKGCTLRYVQRISCSPPSELGSSKLITATASVKLEEVPIGSPLAQVKGAIYYFEFHTERYNRHPLIIQVN